GGSVTSGTTGSILFIGSGPVLAQDNANFFFDDTNNRLGLGTTTPWGMLSVNPNGTLGADIPAFVIGSSTRTLLSVIPNGNNGTVFNWGSVSTSTPIANRAFAWTIATTTTISSSTLFRIDTTTGAEQVIIGAGYGTVGTPGSVLIGDIGAPSNLIFEESSVIHGQGGNTLTFGTTGDKINFVVNTSFGAASSTPWRALSVNGTVGMQNLNAAATGNYLCVNTTTWEVTRGNGSTCTTSSARFKENINDLSYGLDDVMRLRPVSFNYKAETNIGPGTKFGFIAEEINEVLPDIVTFDSEGDVYGLDMQMFPSVLAKAIQELNLNLETIASTTASTTTKSLAFADSFWTNMFGRLIAWFADTANGIVKFFAKEVKTEKLCVSDGTEETCLTKAQLDALLANASGNGNGSGGNGGGNGGGGGTGGNGGGNSNNTDTTLPVITILGNNPATLDLGTSYVDLGATVTDTDENGAVNNNLGIQYNVDGVDVSEISIDTSVVGSHTIIYSSTDGSGNTGTGTRIVEVVDPNPETTTNPEPNPEPTPEPSPEPTPEIVPEP
ncbi:MAG: tail fiber domain-containing protein, partial [Minisyncoccia bacterium]